MESNLSVVDALALQRNDDGMFGGQGGWLWFILILLFMGRGFGFGFGNQDVNVNDEFIKRDLFNMQQSSQACCCETQKEILESRYTTQLGLQNLGQQMSSCCCETNRNIDAVRADAYKNTCEITTAIHAEGEATRALINAQAMQDLRDRLADRDRELMSANLALQNNAQTQTLIDTLQPTPKPAYVTCSPYFSYGFNPCGCGNI